MAGNLEEQEDLGGLGVRSCNGKSGGVKSRCEVCIGDTAQWGTACPASTHEGPSAGGKIKWIYKLGAVIRVTTSEDSLGRQRKQRQEHLEFKASPRQAVSPSLRKTQQQIEGYFLFTLAHGVHHCSCRE